MILHWNVSVGMEILPSLFAGWTKTMNAYKQMVGLMIIFFRYLYFLQFKKKYIFWLLLINLIYLQNFVTAVLKKEF